MQIAVIVPTLNEERTLARVLAALAPQLSQSDQLIVVDGGSTDRTLELAVGAEVLAASRGRGQQLDAGARHALASGADLLLFLHADSTVPPDLLAKLKALNPRVGGGCWVEFVEAPPLLKLGERLVNWRTNRYLRPLGDQGQFATSQAYEAAGGYPHWPILEDSEFIDRLARVGPLDIVESAVGTDARRFRDRGVVRTVVTNRLIWTLHALGFSPERLATFYRNIR